MRFVIVVAEIIGNASTQAQYPDPDLIGFGSPIHMAAGEILMAVARSLPCFNRALDRLSALASKVMARKILARGGRLPA
ncbi:MAG: hypothetical protein K8F62_08785 [Pseudorhodoplanes sp.]|nr:hypothetical protein [Pseudorhodoplanes sp.]